MKKIILLLLTLALALSCNACAAYGKQRYTATLPDYFDTVTTVVAYDTSEKEFQRHLALFKTRMNDYHRLYDIYHTYEGIANLKTINDTAATAPVATDARIISLLSYGKEIYALSGGKTNICFGAVLALWHKARQTQPAQLPAMRALQNAAAHTDINDLIIKDNTVFFKDSQLQLDVGAIAKGYAAKEISAWAEAELWSSAIINIGGNVCAFGTKADDGKTKWTIEIEHPDIASSKSGIETLYATDVSVVTSGDYQRFMTIGDKRYCHIINPETLMPSEYVSSVTIICKDAALADALSTTLFNMPIADGKKLIETMENAEALWVDKTYHKTFSSGFERYIQK